MYIYIHIILHERSLPKIGRAAERHGSALPVLLPPRFQRVQNPLPVPEPLRPCF